LSPRVGPVYTWHVDMATSSTGSKRHHVSMPREAVEAGPAPDNSASSCRRHTSLPLEAMEARPTLANGGWGAAMGTGGRCLPPHVMAACATCRHCRPCRHPEVVFFVNFFDRWSFFDNTLRHVVLSVKNSEYLCFMFSIDIKDG
jgi:hypothetical protein